MYRSDKEIWDDADWRFNFIFEQEKKDGHDDREAARRVHCDIHAERLRFKKMREAKEISEDCYIDGMRILSHMGIAACQVYDRENQKIWLKNQSKKYCKEVFYFS